MEAYSRQKFIFQSRKVWIAKNRLNKFPFYRNHSLIKLEQCIKSKLIGKMTFHIVWPFSNILNHLIIDLGLAFTI
jgi:hypothetical protein